jgi:hypothetical protein
MVPATALGFLLCAGALGSSVQRRYFFAQGCAVAVLLLGGQRLVTYALGTDGFEFLSLAPRVDSADISLGHMSPATAMDFVLRQPKKTAPAFQAVTLLALLIGWLGLTRYLYGGEQLFPTWCGPVSLTVHAIS